LIGGLGTHLTQLVNTMSENHGGKRVLDFGWQKSLVDGEEKESGSVLRLFGELKGSVKMTECKP
jgi:hypothetical protein